ncbi:NAD-dependent epimerase/dehydratase family protein [Metabacillus fastidiosus]|uniref:NAD-dependent epimerase/dehydratase family protein n=1 Tax=Metabacillus fastidiosus TaxID=1458 RepID=UPI002E243EAB|nr:NAD-dependent epimerase/dehydratase family protein [Metabacillus fastidiosus]MED4531862.1 NAD-dependent epimerase/dehydratase family protein [Metabacillus fastidiosus]
MRVFITGITGYVGSVVAQHFLSQGYQVSGLIRSQEKADQSVKMGISPIIGNLADLSVLEESVRKADGVIHTAISHTPDMERLDVFAVKTMLDGLEGTGKPFIYTSGTLIYNDTFQNVVNEDSDLNPLPFLQWKANQEQEVLAAAQRNIRTIVIRPTLIYGRGGGLVQATIKRTKLSQSANYINDGQNAWSTIDVDDLANLYASAYSRAKPGSLFNAASRELITIKELMTSVGKIVGVDKIVSWSYEDAVKAIGPAAWGSSINQRVSGLRAEQQLQWRPTANSILKEIEEGSYQTNTKIKP